jgi:hypothetical protein
MSDLTEAAKAEPETIILDRFQLTASIGGGESMSNLRFSESDEEDYQRYKKAERLSQAAYRELMEAYERCDELRKRYEEAHREWLAAYKQWTQPSKEEA